MRDSLEDWNVRSDEAVLVANELATNAIVHAGSEFMVEVSLFDHTCRIGVVDRAETRPRLHRRSRSAVHGRGMSIVDSMSHKWGVERRHTGKSVWCDVAVTE